MLGSDLKSPEYEGQVRYPMTNIAPKAPESQELSAAVLKKRMSQRMTGPNYEP